MSASKQIKSSYQNVAQSVATVQANRAANGAQGSFITQVKDQIALDRTKRREDEEKGTQRLALFPGWAVRRFESGSQASGEGLFLFRMWHHILSVPQLCPLRSMYSFLATVRSPPGVASIFGN